MKNFSDIRLPQYRLGDFGYSCATCAYIQPVDFHCTKFNTKIDPSYVCNVWKDPFRSENGNLPK